MATGARVHSLRSPANDAVVDASALLLALGGKGDDAAGLRVRLAGLRLHAPHLIDAEVGNVLRRHENTGRLTSEEALQALRAAHVVIAHRYPHAGPLAETAWRIRLKLSFYDALYVALAVVVNAPLITADARLARVPRLPCHVELV